MVGRAAGAAAAWEIVAHPQVRQRKVEGLANGVEKCRIFTFFCSLFLEKNFFLKTLTIKLLLEAWRVGSREGATQIRQELACHLSKTSEGALKAEREIEGTAS